MEIGKKIRNCACARPDTGRTGESQRAVKGIYLPARKRCDFSSIATLVDVLTCLGTDLKTFFGEEQDNQIVFCEEDYFVKTDESQGNEIAWIVPNAQKNRMEPIRLTLQSGACTEVDSPHEGEEFGYVLSGRVLIHLGDECHKAKKAKAFTTPPPVTTIWKTRAKRPLSFSGSVHRLIFRFPHRVIFTKNGAPK